MFGRRPAPALDGLETALPATQDTSDRWPVVNTIRPCVYARSTPGTLFTVVEQTDTGATKIEVFLPADPAAAIDLPDDMAIEPTPSARQSAGQDVGYLIGLAVGAHERIRTRPDPRHPPHQQTAVLAHSHSLLRGLLQTASSPELETPAMQTVRPGSLDDWTECSRAVALAVALYRHSIRECSDWTYRRYPSA